MAERRGSHDHPVNNEEEKMKAMYRRRWSVDSSATHLAGSLNLTLRSRRRAMDAAEDFIFGLKHKFHNGKHADADEQEKVHGYRHYRRNSLQKLFHFSHSKKKKHMEPAYAIIFLHSGKANLLSSEDGPGLRELISQASMEHRISSYRMIMDTTRSILNSDSSSGSPVLDSGLEDVFEELTIPDDVNELTELDSRKEIVEDLLRSEKEYCKSLRGILDTYAEPLRKFSSLTSEDHRILFVGLEPIISISHMLTTKIEDALKSWDTHSTPIGSLFNSKKLWSVHEEYCTSYPHTKQFLDQKLASDSSFVEFCNLRRGQATQDLESLLYLPVQRIPEYDKYLHELLEDTDPSHPDFDDLSKAAIRTKRMVREHEDDLGTNKDNVKMDRIQQRFPNDDLQLRDSTPQNCRSLSARRKSAPGAVLFKTLGKSKSSSNLWSAGNNWSGKKDMDMVSPIRQHSNNNRQFVLEGPVEFATGMQKQDRYLFLFNDLLLVAKQKSSTTFKLKHRIRVCEMWLATCVYDVSECTVPPDKSFVMGWPTTNVVATFKSVELKDLWLNKLNETIEFERMREANKSVQIMVMYKEKNQCQSLQVESHKTAKEVLLEAIEKFNIAEADRGDCQLWVTSSREESPYPLIGHELPHAIRTSELRDLTHTDDPAVSLDLEQKFDETGSPDKNAGFMLKIKTKFSRKSSYEDGSKVKDSKKHKLRLPFRKNKDDKNNNKTPGTPTPGILYGRHLSEVMETNGELPKPIMDMLKIIFQRGPFKEGILRKSASKMKIEDFHRRIDNGEEDVLNEDIDPLLAGCLLKEYLRCLPSCLLCGNLYPEWKQLDEEEDTPEKFVRVQDLLKKIPSENYELLRHLLCVLYHIALRKDRNKMDARNLAVCIAPSIVYEPRDDSKNVKRKELTISNYSKPLFPLVQYMIENCAELFGENVINLFGNAPEEPPQDNKLRHDSSGTDTDSCHSIMDSASGSHSIDSLEKDLYIGERDPSPHQRLNHISPSGLSKDSGHYSSQEALDMKTDFEIQVPRPRDPLLRQRPVIENTPPASPQSSSVDSLLTDSTGSFITNRQFSRDTETSDSYYTAEESVRDSFDSDVPTNFSTGSLHGKSSQYRQFSPPASPKNVRKLHPGELHQNLSGRRSLPLPLSIHSFETPKGPISSRMGHSAMDLSVNSNAPSIKTISKYNLGLATSPPPRVILKQMKQMSIQRQENSSSPMRASLDSAILSQIDNENHRSEMKINKFHFNTPKVLEREKDNSPTMTHVHNPDTPKSRPEKPPSYDEAVKRQNMLKNCALTEQDIQRQKEAQMKAKRLYEESLKRFQENSRIPEDSESDSETSENDVYVGLKNPRKVYEESIKMFEQQVKRTPSPHRESVTPPRSQESMSSSSTYSEKGLENKHLSVPPCTLHRSFSDSSEHVNKANVHRRRDVSPRYSQSPERQGSPSTRLEYSSSSVSNSSSETVTDSQQSSPYQRDRSESSPVIQRHRFPTTSPSAFNAQVSPHHSAQYSDSRYSNSRLNSRVSRSVDNSLKDRNSLRNSPSSNCSRDSSADSVLTSHNYLSKGVIVRDSSVDSLLTSRNYQVSKSVNIRDSSADSALTSRDYPIPKSVNISSNSSSNSSSRDTSRSSTPSRESSNTRKTTKSQDLPWSVKSLKQIYDPNGTQSSSVKLAGSRPPPPPYQPPPPFRRPDSSRMSNSSQSSVGSGSTGRSTPPTKLPSQRRLGGPQSIHYSSAEDSDGVSYV